MLQLIRKISGNSDGRRINVRFRGEQVAPLETKEAEDLLLAVKDDMLLLADQLTDSAVRVNNMRILFMCVFADRSVTGISPFSLAVFRQPGPERSERLSFMRTASDAVPAQVLRSYHYYGCARVCE